MFKICHGDGIMSDARRTARHKETKSRSTRMSRTRPPNPIAADASADRKTSQVRLKRAGQPRGRDRNVDDDAGVGRSEHRVGRISMIPDDEVREQRVGPVAAFAMAAPDPELFDPVAVEELTVVATRHGQHAFASRARMGRRP
jgi:hypothetical protein